MPAYGFMPTSQAVSNACFAIIHIQNPSILGLFKEVGV